MARYAAALKKALGQDMFERVRLAGRLAADAGGGAYLVGGCVRDLLLKRPIKDVDIGVNGDAVLLALEMETFIACRVKRHIRYRNAALLFPDGAKIDLASARRESYPAPAELPVVEPAASPLDDFLRRDFTINAMAISLDPKTFGRLFDPLGGAKDLRDGIIRALHARSFIDDPTRIMRAFRFAARFNFRIEAATARWMRLSIKAGFPMKLSDRRLAAELDLVLREHDPAPCLMRLFRAGAFNAYSPDLLRTAAARKGLASTRRALDEWTAAACGDAHDRRRAWTLALLRDVPPRRALAFLERMEWSDNILMRDLEGMPRARARLTRSGRLRNATICRALTPLSLEAALYLSADASRSAVVQAARKYLFDLRFRKPRVTGADLLGIGIAPGPRMGVILSKIRDAVIDGKLADREEELDYAKRVSGRGPRESGKS